MRKRFFNFCGKTVGKVLKKLNGFYSVKQTLLAMAFGIFIISGCKKNDHDKEPANVLKQYTGLSTQTLAELNEVQIATSRYKNIQNAVADGYTDINVVVQNMGFHYMKASLADTAFDYKKPEILVYNKDEN